VLKLNDFRFLLKTPLAIIKKHKAVVHRSYRKNLGIDKKYVRVSSGDIDYMSYCYNGLNNREIGDLLVLDYSMVSVERRRLRKRV